MRGRLELIKDTMQILQLYTFWSLSLLTKKEKETGHA